MIYLKQFFILLTFVLIGQIVGFYLNFSANILSLVLFFIALLCKVIKVEDVDEVASFLLKIAPLFFIPFIVSSLLYIDIIKPIFIYFMLICIGSTIVTMAVTLFFMSLIEGKKWLK